MPCESTQIILARLDQLESLLIEATGRRPPDRSICSWREAADLLGVTGNDPRRRALAASKRLHRLTTKADGPSIRLYRNGAHRGDLTRYLDESARPSTSDQIREALRPQRRGVTR